MRTEAEVRAKLRYYFRKTLRFRRYAQAARAEGNLSQWQYDARVADYYESGFQDLYWVLHPDPESGNRYD